MSRYIDAEQAHNLLKSVIEEQEAGEKILRIVDALLFDSCDEVKMVPVIHAHWKVEEEWDNTKYVCSHCKEPFCFEYGSAEDNGYKYCPNCGAKMDEGVIDDVGNSN